MGAYVKNFAIAAVTVAWLTAAYRVSAQFTPLDVAASVPILNYTGAVLPGSLTNFGCADAPGGLVQILQVGTGGVAHLPNLDGTPSGGDTVLFTTVIGDYNGLDPCATGHQLDTSFSPRPANGTKIFARVFNASTISNATYWGQSATYAVTNPPAVFDVSTAGLRATTMPKGVDLTTIVDVKGQTYFTDLIANLDPLDPNDVLASSGLIVSSSQLTILAHVGRLYTLQRTTNLLAPTVWTNLTTAGPFSVNTPLMLTDPSPPNSSNVFYRVRVTMP